MLFIIDHVMNIGFAYVACRDNSQTFKFILDHFNDTNINSEYDKNDVLHGKPVLFLVLIEPDNKTM